MPNCTGTSGRWVVRGTAGSYKWAATRLDAGPPCEGRLAGQQEIGQGTDAINVAPGVHLFLPARLFRRHVGWRAGDGTFLCQLLAPQALPERYDQAEVEQLGRVVSAASRRP